MDSQSLDGVRFLLICILHASNVLQSFIVILNWNSEIGRKNENGCRKFITAMHRDIDE